MEMQLVIARFSEDLSWLERFPQPKVVYDKGRGDLPNIGFEAHTFLHHFASRYDELAEVTVCLQGDPVPHCPEGINGLVEILSGINPSRFSYMPIARTGRWQKPDGSPNHPGLGPDNDKMWRLLKGCHPPDLWHSWYGGQFAVHRDLVRRRPAEFWRAARDAVVTKNEACAMERLWGNLMV